jgi:hypothetical protein
MGPSTTIWRGDLKLGLGVLTREIIAEVQIVPRLGHRTGLGDFVAIASYQDFAITVMMRASESTSCVSITSAGECE